MRPISGNDLHVYEAVLAWIADEYAGDGDTIRVENSTMASCDTTGQVYRLDCARERDAAVLEQRWADGSRAFGALIDDSTSRQLAESYRVSSDTVMQITGFDSSRFVVRTATAIGAEKGDWYGGRPIGSVSLSRASYSSDGHAYVYAVFSRVPGYGRGPFAAGLIFLLRGTGEKWELLAWRGTWVT
jgi:hypothetical protein